MIDLLKNEKPEIVIDLNKNTEWGVECFKIKPPV